MPDHLGEDMRKTKNEEVKEEKDIKGKSFCSSCSPDSRHTLNFLLGLQLSTKETSKFLKPM